MLKTRIVPLLFAFPDINAARYPVKRWHNAIFDLNQLHFNCRIRGKLLYIAIVLYVQDLCQDSAEDESNKETTMRSSIDYEITRSE